jgi:hypothetical protein
MNKITEVQAHLTSGMWALPFIQLDLVELPSGEIQVIPSEESDMEKLQKAFRDLVRLRNQK